MGVLFGPVPPDFIDRKEKGISDQSEGEINENGVFHCFPHELVKGWHGLPEHALIRWREALEQATASRRFGVKRFPAKRLALGGPRK